MAGYTRQSVADIIANAVIKAAPVNAEFNAIRDAFNASTGHKHDGTSAEGSFVPLIADLDGNNKVVVDTANNRISFYNEVSSAAVEQIRLEDGVLKPVTDDDIDLGATGAEFKDLYIDGIGYIDSVVITGGTIDGTTIGGSTAAAGTFTNLTATGTTTITTADINGGAIDGTTIGASSAAAGTFTTVTTTGQATLATADINGGTIDGTVIGGTSAQSITGTTITANTGFSGVLTGNVTGNVTGALTGDVTGNVTGDLTGDVTSSGSSSFEDVTINGTLNMNAGTTATITNLTTPVNAGDAATKGYVDTAVSDLVDSAPAALDTLNELAAALGDDAAFSTTITNSIATKLPLAGGTMTGAIAMGTSKITGLGDPTANQDAATKTYVDTADANKLNLSGGTMTGGITMGSNKVTSTATPTADSDLTRKAYVDSILGSATSAADSAAAAATSETNAGTSETNAGNSASAAASSASDAAASYDSFDDRYLGAKASAPTLDNDGDALLTGALYWNSSSNELYIWSGSAWEQGSFTAGSLLANVVDDTTPQLGGDLDLNGNNITGTGNIDGRDVSADGTKLDGIESGADVTDTANVTAAGALMDSELTSQASVKSLDQGVATTDSPTFVTLNATTVDFGNWTITESGGSLYFATGGTNKMKLDASGNLDVVGNVNTNATIT